MPVRIYDIARKFGLESKVVIAKAKELGITHAKVASSTLDKITAEYLEEKLAPARVVTDTPAADVPHPVDDHDHGGPSASPAETPALTSAPEAAPSPVVVPAPVAAAPAHDVRGPSEAARPATATPPVESPGLPPGLPPVLLTPHAPVVPAVVPAPVTPPAIPPMPVAAVEPPAAIAIPAPVAASAPVARVEPSVVIPDPVVAPAVPVVATAPAAAALPAGKVVTPATSPTPVVGAAVRAEVPAVTPSVPAPAAPAVAAPPAAVPAPSTPVAGPAPAPVPAPPPAPRTPGLGELVGRIELPFRGRTSGRAPAPPPPPPPPQRRPEPPQGQRRPGMDSRGRPGMGQGRPPMVFAPGSRPPAGQSQAGGRSGPGGPKAPSLPDYSAPADGPVITLKPPIIVRDLAERMGIKAYRLLHDLMELGVFANLNQSVDEKVAQFIAARHGFRFEVERREKGAGQVHAPVKKVELDTEDSADQLKLRPPVITIMGHVDHGKTTLLDVIRKSDVAAKEAGGITQHIGAYTIMVPHPEKVGELQQLTFLDTPGHAAFSAMRARGANVTDIVILVVAASEGVMPQTVEALNHAKAAKVPIMVAVNKCDLPSANPLRTRQQLQEHGLVPEEWGGETIYVDVSAASKTGIDQLLAMLVLQADVMELKANPNRRAKGNVIESGLEPGGPTATVLVRKGTLKLGEVVICGQYYGRTRALISEEGTRLKEAGPSVAVRILGLNGVPEAGLEFSVVENERTARALAEEREMQVRAAGWERGPRVTLDNFLKVIEAQSAKILKVVIKGDTQGSVEAIVEALKKIDSSKVELEVVHSAVGTITESDVLLAASAKGIIVGFHTRLDNGVPAAAKREGVQIKQYEIIYELIDEVRNAMAGLLDPELKEVTLGSAEVRQIFDLSKGGRVAGCMVLNGRIIKGKARVVRRKEIIHDGILGTLRRYQDEVAEVRSGLECGIRVSSFDDFQPGDVVESYTVEKVAQQL